MPVRSEFVASDKTEEEICRELGADALIYQSLDDLVAVGHDLNPSITEFDTSCFTGALSCVLCAFAEPAFCPLLQNQLWSRPCLSSAEQ